jgi:hypothetical protein
MSFTSVIEDIQVLDFEDKIKVQFLLNIFLIEDKRERIE